MRKRITYWIVAAVVTGALVVGGVQLAGRSGSQTPARLPALTAAATGQANAAGANGAQSATMVPAPQIASRAFPAYTIQVRGALPSLPRAAHAWVLAPGSSSEQAAQVAALAGKLGLAGKPVATAAGWTVTDGRRRLIVGRLAGMPWSFDSQFTATCGGPSPTGVYNGPMCPAGGAAAPGSASGTGSATGVPRMVCGARTPNCPVPEQGQGGPGVRLPSTQSAEQTAFALLTRLGVQPDTAAAQPVRLADRWQISAPVLVGGLPAAGFMWSVGVGAQNQIRSASGWLASPKQGGNYPLITVQEALDRLRGQRAKGPIVVPMPAEPVPCPLTETKNVACRASSPKVVRTVTGVRLGLVFTTPLLKPGAGAAASASAAAQTGYLVPAFLFRLEGGGWTDEVPVVAVQDRFLTQPPPATVRPLQSGAAGGGSAATP